MCIPFRQFSNLLADTYYVSFNQGTDNDMYMYQISIYDNIH